MSTLSLDFTYGLGNQQIKIVQTRNSTIERVKYFNVDYEEDSTATGVKKYHYIQGGSGLTAIFVMNGSGNDTMYYVLPDHLGSFTGHEHLMEFNLINMNDRIYNPILGRFLSPDPFVQMPGYPNSYNRYSYVLNNPLRFTDLDLPHECGR